MCQALYILFYLIVKQIGCCGLKSKNFWNGLSSVAVSSWNGRVTSELYGGILLSITTDLPATLRFFIPTGLVWHYSNHDLFLSCFNSGRKINV